MLLVGLGVAGAGAAVRAEGKTGEAAPSAAPVASPMPGTGAAQAAAADTPPPSAYDRAVAEGKLDADKPQEGERTLLSQAVRTLFSLALVVALVYLFGKTLLPRLAGLKLGQSGKVVKVVERVQLDARHAVVLVDIVDGPRLLLGTGEQGVQVLTDLGREPAATEASGGFSAVLERSKETPETPA